MDTRAKLKPKIDFIQSTADPAVFAKKLTQVALRRAVLTRTVDQIFNPDERDEIEEEMQESDHNVAYVELWASLRTIRLGTNRAGSGPVC